MTGDWMEVKVKSTVYSYSYSAYSTVEVGRRRHRPGQNEHQILIRNQIIISHTIPRPQHELSILEEIALAGPQGAFISGEAAGAIGKLVQGNLISTISVDGDGGWYQLSAYGASLLNISFCLSKPTPLLSFERKGATSLDVLTTLELVQLLASRGWKDQSSSKKKHATPYSEGQERIWWRKPGKSINERYLKALAKEEDILKANEQIFHFQSKAYYSALLHGCKALPNQPLAYYNQVIKMQSGQSGRKKKGQKRPREAHMNIQGSEEDLSDSDSKTVSRLFLKM